MPNEESKHEHWAEAVFLSVLVLCITAVCIVSMFTDFWKL
jgi:hypothetical protein